MSDAAARNEASRKTFIACMVNETGCVCEIRLHAEHKAGELLAQMEKAKGGCQKTSGSDPGVSRRPTLRDLGVSEDQSSRWQQLGCRAGRWASATTRPGFDCAS